MTWEACDVDLTLFTPDQVTLTPDPPVIGSPAVFNITGIIDSDIQGGTVEMTVSFSGLPIFSQTLDLCSKTTCPVPKGHIKLTLVEALPPIAPPGDYGLQVIARSTDGTELTCVSVTFSLVLPSAGASGSAALAAAAAAAAGESADGHSAGFVRQHRRHLRV